MTRSTEGKYDEALDGAEELMDEVLLGRGVQSTTGASRKRIRPTDLDDGSLMDGDEDERKAGGAVAAKRRKRQSLDAGKKGTSQAHKELLEKFQDVLAQKSEKELLNGGRVEWTFQHEAKMVLATTASAKVTLTKN